MNRERWARHDWTREIRPRRRLNRQFSYYGVVLLLIAGMLCLARFVNR